MQINKTIKTLTQKFTIKNKSLMKSVRIFKGAPSPLVLNLGAPRVETFFKVHQCSTVKIAWPKGFCS
jgi:hypothetical protein